MFNDSASVLSFSWKKQKQHKTSRLETSIPVITNIHQSSHISSNSNGYHVLTYWMCPATIYLRHSTFLMTAWPDFPSAQRLKISFIWKRLKCKIQNHRGRASGWHCNKELNLSQMSFFLISSWFVYHCGFAIKPLWVDFLPHVEHCALWPLGCVCPVSRKSSAILA